MVAGMDRPHKRRAAPKKLTPERLEKAALHYLERFASSAENLRRVLMRKVERAARAAEHAGGEADRAEPARWVDALVTRYVASGLLDDRAYAEAASASLRRQGRSARAIRQKLATKGIGKEEAEAALARAGGADDAAELRAAAALARRRRLGPFGP
ncbi:MAG: RecX family transcriptional regulator, partial [Alphaproteobacteria bacterium]|nr:RecX family transcriptional regulator [Alphaproteobacteria bacterium]